MPVLLGGLELPETLLLFLFSLHNPREGLEPLWPEIFRLAFFIFLLAVCQDKRAVMLTSSRGHILAIFPPPPRPQPVTTGTQKCLEGPARVDGEARSGGCTWYPPSLLAFLGSPWHSNFLAGVVRSSLPSMSGGPAQRAMPGSL